MSRRRTKWKNYIVLVIGTFIMVMIDVLVLGSICDVQEART